MEDWVIMQFFNWLMYFSGFSVSVTRFIWEGQKWRHMAESSEFFQRPTRGQRKAEHQGKHLRPPTWPLPFLKSACALCSVFTWFEDEHDIERLRKQDIRKAKLCLWAGIIISKRWYDITAATAALCFQGVAVLIISAAKGRTLDERTLSSQSCADSFSWTTPLAGSRGTFFMLPFVFTSANPVSGMVIISQLHWLQLGCFTSSTALPLTVWFTGHTK